MKKRDFIGYVLELGRGSALSFIYAAGDFKRLDSICFEVESSGLRMDELFMCRSSIFSHLHFQTNKVFVIENLNADPDILFNYINLEVSSTPQFHSYTLRKILEIHDEIVAKVRFQEAGTEVLVRIVETDFSTGIREAMLIPYSLILKWRRSIMPFRPRFGKRNDPAVQR